MATCHLYAECFQGEGAEFGDDGDGKSKVYNYPVVRREPRSQGYSYSLLNGEPRSYLEFSNHLIDDRKDTGQKTWETHQQALKYIEILRTLPG